MKDITDENLIEEDKANIKNIVSKKIMKNNEYLSATGDRLLLYNNTGLNNKNQTIKKNIKQRVLSMFLLYFKIILKIIF